MLDWRLGQMPSAFRRDGREATACPPGPIGPARVTVAQQAVELRCVLVSRAHGGPEPGDCDVEGSHAQTLHCCGDAVSLLHSLVKKGGLERS